MAAYRRSLPCDHSTLRRPPGGHALRPEPFPSDHGTGRADGPPDGGRTRHGRAQPPRDSTRQGGHTADELRRLYARRHPGGPAVAQRADDGQGGQSQPDGGWPLRFLRTRRWETHRRPFPRTDSARGLGTPGGEGLSVCALGLCGRGSRLQPQEYSLHPRARLPPAADQQGETRAPRTAQRFV